MRFFPSQSPRDAALRSRFVFSGAASLLLGGPIVLACAVSALGASEPTLKAVSLGEVSRLKLDGLESDHPREALEAAKKFAAFRNRRLSRKEQKTYTESCRTSQDAYCSFLSDPHTRKAGEKLRAFLSQLFKRDSGKNSSALDSSSEEEDAPMTWT
jgi:hypothetical protein